ncbi:MAG: hypothetical protein O9341_05305, partial [Paucibacter sp.]|nr:hypothetical protein [Roseateles sp.]
MPLNSQHHEHTPKRGGDDMGKAWNRNRLCQGATGKASKASGHLVVGDLEAQLFIAAPAPARGLHLLG